MRNTKFKFMAIALLVTVMNVNASVVRVAELLFNSAQLRNLVQMAIQESSNAAPRVVSTADNIARSIRAIVGEAGTHQNLITEINGISVTDSIGVRYKAQVLELLQRSDVGDINLRDIELLNDALSGLALRSGRFSAAMACNACLRDSSAVGTLVLREVTNPRIQSIMRGLPRNENSLNRFLNTGMRELRLGTITRNLDYDDKVALGIYIGVLRHGNRAEKRLARAIRLMSTYRNNTELAGSGFSQNFYKLFSEDMPEEDMVSLTSFLNEFNARNANIPLGGRKADFYAMLEEISQNNPTKREALERLRSRNCFFL